ncbi:MAG: 50S ribosomal protein L24e [Thermoplasmata archaeon]
MVERRVCTFCGDEIEPGTGRMYIKKDGIVYHFCTSKCFKNMIVLNRVPRRTTWTRYYEREKQVRMKGGAEEAEAPRARKVKKEEKAEGKKLEEAEKLGERAKSERAPKKAEAEKKEKLARKAEQRQQPGPKAEEAEKK